MHYLHFLISWLRLALVLLLALVGAPHGDAFRTAQTSLPVAVDETTVSPAILTAQGHLPRVHLPDGDPSRADLVLPDNPAAVAPPTPIISRQRDVLRVTGDVHILPRVRGPPVI